MAVFLFRETAIELGHQFIGIVWEGVVNNGIALGVAVVLVTAISFGLFYLGILYATHRNPKVYANRNALDGSKSGGAFLTKLQRDIVCGCQAERRSIRGIN
jgi:hypothetical protein